MKMDREEIIRKARKLAAFNNENATENEVANATKILAKMLDKYQLSQADIEAKDIGEDVVEGPVETGCKTIMSWQKALLAALTEGFGCRLIISREADTSAGALRWLVVYKVIGATSDVTVVQYLAEILTPKLRKMGCEQGKTYGYAGGTLRGYVNSFVIGAAQTISRRLRENRQEASSDSRALVVVKNKEISEFVKERYPRLRSGAPINCGNARGLADGKAAGRKVSLARGIGEREQAKRIA